MQPADQCVQRDARKDFLSVAADVDHAGMRAARENGDPFPLHVGGQETLIQDPRVRFPLPIGRLPVMGLETPLEAPSGDLAAEGEQAVEDLLRHRGDEHPSALVFEDVPERHVLEREEFAAGQPQTPLDEGPRCTCRGTG